MISVHFQGKPFNIIAIQVYAPRTYAKKAKVDRFYEGLQYILELTITTTTKSYPCHHKGLECKSRKWGDTQNNSQVWPWSIKWSRARARRVLLRELLVIANNLFQQPKRWLYTWTSPDGQYRNQIDYILCSQKWRNPINSTKTRPGVDCGSNHELLIVKFRIKFDKVGKTTRTYKYDLNKIPYDYTVEMTNRFKRVDLVDCLKDYRQKFITFYRRKWPKPSQRKRNARRQNGCLRNLYI